MLIESLYRSFSKINKEIPFIARKQCMYIPTPTPMDVKIPAFLPYKDTCLIVTAVSGPGLVKAIKCAIDDQINILKKNIWFNF